MNHRKLSVGLSISLPIEVNSWVKTKAEEEKCGTSEIIRRILLQAMRSEQNPNKVDTLQDIGIKYPIHTTGRIRPVQQAAESRPEGAKSYDRKSHK